MGEHERGGGPDNERLAKALQVLGSPTRLALLAALRMPTPLREVRLQPARNRPGENPDRPASTQTVRAHLRKLMAEDLATELDGATNRYVVNRRRLFEVSEDLNGLTNLWRGRSLVDDDTQTRVPTPMRNEHEGPRLVLVHGAYQGSVFPLARGTSRGGAWVIGREEDTAVSLDYDPFVSRHHATVQQEGDEFLIIDHGTSRNGTTVNWRLLEKGVARPLRPGDVVGVGRSLLVFADTHRS